MEEAIRRMHLELVRAVRGCNEIKTKQCGLIICKDNPRLGGSPDDLVCDPTEAFLQGDVEYKYIPSVGDRKFISAISERKPDVIDKKSGKTTRGPKRLPS